MAQSRKILGQAAPGAGGGETVLYTVPAGKSALVSSLTVANRHATLDATFRIAVVPAADVPSATQTKHYIAYEVTAFASDVYVMTIGITLAAGDAIRVLASTANLSMSVFGVEG